MATRQFSGNKLPRLKKMPNWAILADMPVEIAIGKLSGMKILSKPKSLKKLSAIVKKEIKRYNVYVQIKDTDHYSHKGDAISKKKAIEKIDKDFIRNIKDLKNTIIAITADHSTPCSLMAHSTDKVPFLISTQRHSSKTFSEKQAGKTGINIRAVNLLKMIINNTKHFK